MRSLYDYLHTVEDYRDARGRRYQLATVLCLAVAARLAGYRGAVPLAEVVQSLFMTGRLTPEEFQGNSGLPPAHSTPREGALQLWRKRGHFDFALTQWNCRSVHCI